MIFDLSLALYGWFFFNLLLLGFSKDKEDEQQRRFNIKIWWQYHWDNVFISLSAVPIIIVFRAELWKLIVNNWIGKDWEYNSLTLLGAVPLIQLIYFFIRKISR